MPESKDNAHAPEAHAEGEFRLPSKAEFSAARKRREKVAEQTFIAFGTVIGLDKTKWATGLIDLCLSQVRQAYYRKRYADKGYVKLEGNPTVIGYELGCEVWVKPVEDRKAAIAERRRIMETHVAQGRMHRSALGGDVQVRKLRGPNAA